MTVGAGPAVAGAELELRAVASNEGAEPRTLRLRLSLCAVRYTGVSGAPFRQEQHRRAVPPGQGETSTPRVPSVTIAFRVSAFPMSLPVSRPFPQTRGDGDDDGDLRRVRTPRRRPGRAEVDGGRSRGRNRPSGGQGIAGPATRARAHPDGTVGFPECVVSLGSPDAGIRPTRIPGFSPLPTSGFSLSRARQLLAPAVVGQETPVQVVFQNPLPETLSGATLRMEGAGISCPKPFQMG